MLHRSVHYNGDGDMTAIQLTPLPDGPYRVEGDVTILDREGGRSRTRGSPVHLCRCGRSADKPFCDGSHARSGWKAAHERGHRRRPTVHRKRRARHESRLVAEQKGHERSDLLRAGDPLGGVGRREGGSVDVRPTPSSSR